MRKIIGVIIILIGIYCILESIFILEDFYLINRDNLYVFLNNSYFPHYEIVVSLFLITYGIMVIKQNNILLVLLIGVLIPYIYFEIIIGFKFNFLEGLQSIFTLLGFILLLQILLKNKLLSYLKNRSFFLSVFFIGIFLVISMYLASSNLFINYF